MTQDEWLKKVEKTIYETVRAMGEVVDLGIDKAVLAAAAAALEAAALEAAALLARIRKGELDPRRGAEALGMGYDQDDIVAILEAAAGSAQSSSPHTPDGAASRHTLSAPAEPSLTSPSPKTGATHDR